MKAGLRNNWFLKIERASTPREQQQYHFYELMTVLICRKKGGKETINASWRPLHMYTWMWTLPTGFKWYGQDCMGFPSKFAKSSEKPILSLPQISRVLQSCMDKAQKLEIQYVAKYVYSAMIHLWLS